MENGPFEDVFPIEHGDIPASYVSLPEGSQHQITFFPEFWVSFFNYSPEENLGHRSSSKPSVPNPKSSLVNP